MNKEDQSKVESFFRQIVVDDIKKLGINAVHAMAEDLRESGYVEKARLLDLLVKEYNSRQVAR